MAKVAWQNLTRRSNRLKGCIDDVLDPKVRGHFHRDIVPHDYKLRYHFSDFIRCRIGVTTIERQPHWKVLMDWRCVKQLCWKVSHFIYIYFFHLKKMKCFEHITALKAWKAPLSHHSKTHLCRDGCLKNSWKTCQSKLVTNELNSKLMKKKLLRLQMKTLNCVYKKRSYKPYHRETAVWWWKASNNTLWLPWQPYTIKVLVQAEITWSINHTAHDSLNIQS